MSVYPGTAVVLLVHTPGGDRFYCGVSKAKRLQTAWSLAGAKLFGPWDIKGIEKAEKEILKRKRTSRRVMASVQVYWKGTVQ